MRRLFIHLTLLIPMLWNFALLAEADDSGVLSSEGINLPVVKITSSGQGVSREDLMGVDTVSQQKSVASAFQMIATPMASGSVTGGESPTNLTNHFQLETFSGTGIFQYPIALPPGRAGLQPSVVLTYSSSVGNGPLGMGWSLDFGSIERSAKDGVPDYDNTDTFLSTLGGGVQELVATGNGNYRARDEGAFITYTYDGLRWIARDTGGRTYYFGLDQVFNDVSRVKDPQDANRVYRWRLSEVKDIHGNYYLITYSADGAMTIYYTGEPGTDRQGIGTAAQKLAVKVSIETESADRPDLFVGYRSGFEIAASRRIKNIRVEAGGEIYQSCVLNYSVSTRTGQSLLSTISTYGSDGNRAFPDVTFSYTGQEPVPYQLSSILNDPAVGDNLWNIRMGGTINVHENLYSVLPRYTGNQGAFIRDNNVNKFEGYINWGTPYVVSYYSKGGTVWNHLGGGMLDYKGAQDTSFHAWIYVYSLTDQTVYLNITGSEVDGYVNQGPGTYTPGGVHARNYSFNQGYNLIEVGGYHNHATNTFKVSTNLTNHFPVVNSSQVVVPQLAGDFNGDGFVDVATYYSQVGNVKVALSNGTGFAPKVQWGGGLGINQQIILGDYNRDGRADLCVMNSLNGQWRVFISDGSKLVDQGVWISNFGVNGQPGAIDFDGDGRTDIVSYYKDGGQLKVRVALNTGNAFGLDQVGIVVSSSDLAQPLTSDFNGDGLPDFGSFRKDTGTWEIRINDGRGAYLRWPDITGFGLNRNPVVADFNLDGRTDLGYYDHPTGKMFYRPTREGGFSVQQQLTIAFNLRDSLAQVQTADFNGDGIVDYAVYNEVGNLEVALSGHFPADLLRQVDNGIGGIRKLRYAPSTRFENAYLPFVIHVIDMMILGTTLGDEYFTRYEYARGLWDTGRREFRGFGTVRQIDPDGHYRESEYLQDEFTQGRLSRQRFFGYGKTQPFTDQKMLWETQEVGNGARFVYLKEKVNYSYDGNTVGKATAESFTYGEIPQYGNLTQIIQHGEVETSSVPGKIVDKTGIQDTRRFEIKYAAVNLSTGVSGLPAQTRVYNHAGELVRKTDFAYDNLSYGVVPVKGLLTLKKDWGGDQTGALHPETRYAYDAYGNLVKITDPSGQSTSIVFDETYHLFPMTVTNAKNHTVTNRYFGINSLTAPTGCLGLWGQLFETTDPNQKAGQRCYDAAGRIVKTVSSLDTHAYPTSTMEYFYGDGFARVKSSRRIQSGRPETVDAYEFADGLGRVIQTKAPTKDPNRWAVSGVTTYTSRGQAHSQFNPFFSDESLDYLYTESTVPAGTPETVFNYDAMGRRVRTDYPDNTYSNVVYNKWTTESFDENGHKQTFKFDAYGRLSEKIEHFGADGRASEYPSVNFTDYAITRYQYDSEGQLVKTIDAKNNQTIIEYDKLGRKVRMVDPDMGTWIYRYDLNGNLVEQIDNKGQTIYFTYDQLNRLTRKFDNLKLEVNYHYDSDSSPTSSHEKGRLTEVNYGKGFPESTAFEYDTLGRELKSIKAINGADYSVERNYDALNNLMDITYPDGEKVYYKYNNAGQIEKTGNDQSILNGSHLDSEVWLLDSGGVIHTEKVLKPASIFERFAKSVFDFIEENILGISTSYAATDFTTDSAVKAVWMMSSNGANESDMTANGQTMTQTGGTISASTSVPPGYTGTSRDFETADTEYLVRPDGGAIDIYGANQSMSICFWAQPESLVNEPTVVAKYYGSGSNTAQYMLFFANRGSGYRAEFLLDSDGVLGNYAIATSANNTIAVGQWVHVCGVYDDALASGNMKVYLNGALSGTPLNYTAGIANTTQELRLGSRGTSTIGNVDHSFDGLLTEVAIFNRALSASEVLSIKNYGLKGNQGNQGSDTTSPTVPTGLTAAPVSTAQINLSWSASTDNVGVAGYRVYRNGTQIADVAGIEYNNTGLQAATTYAYTVRAFDAAGNVSNQSAAVSVSTLSATNRGETIAVLEAESMATKTTGGAVSDGWNIWSNGYIQDWVNIPASGEYTLVVRAKGELAGADLPSMALRVDGVRVQYADVGTTEWTDYTFTVWLNAGSRVIGAQFMNDYYASPLDRNLVVDKITVRTAGIQQTDTVAPSVPGGLTVNDVSTDQVDLSWNPSTDNVGVSGYKIYRNGTQIADVSGTEYNDTGLPAATTYAYTVRAYDAAGNVSAPSAVLNVTTESAQSGSHVIAVLEAETMATKTTGGAVPDGWNIWANGYIQDAVTVSQTGDYVIDVRAKGELAGSQLPRMDLRVDGVRVDSASVGQTQWTDYAFTVSLNAGTHQIGAQFMNDYYAAPLDRNLLVDKITIRTPGILPTAAVVYVEDVEYNAAGQVERIVLGNGVTTEYTYDSRMRVKSVFSYDASGGVIQDFVYRYDGAGNILEIIDSANTASQTFAYDHLNRLERAQDSATYGVKDYAYDEIGNITMKDGKAYTYGEGGAGPHAVTRTIGGGVTTTYTYDANGNMETRQIGSEITFFDYDVENRLMEVKKGASESTAKKVEEYFYDGDGGRTRKISYNNGVYESTTKFVGSLFEETGGNRTGYIFLGGTRVASITNGEVMWYLHDHLGGTNVLTDADAQVKQIIEYTPFGAESRNEKFGLSPEIAARYAFTNHYKDERTGLIFMQARYYDPTTGRFLTPDTLVQSPKGNSQTFNRYSYCGNNPVNFVDPSGHWFFAAIAAIFKAVTAAVVAHPVIAGAVVGGAAGGIQSYQATGSVNPLSIGIGAVSGGLAGGTLGMSSAALAKIGSGGFLLKASAGASLLAQVTGAAGLGDISQGFQYASMGLSAAYLGLNIGIGIRDWAYESRFKITDLSGNTTGVTSNSHVHVNGITTGFDDALAEAGQREANYLAYNPTSGLIPDLAEGLLDKLTFTSSVSRQLGGALNGLSGITLSGFSQGGMIASNTALALGLRDQRQVIGQLRVYSTQISQARVAVSGAVGGGLTWQKTVTYGVGSPWDFSNALGPNMGPAFFSGLVGVSALPIGVGNHRMPQ